MKQRCIMGLIVADSYYTCKFFKLIQSTLLFERTKKILSREGTYYVPMWAF